MPDLSVLLELAKYFEVDVGEVLDGERKDGNMDKKLEETISKVADYEQFMSKKLTRLLHRFLLLGAASMALALLLRGTGLTREANYNTLASLLEGIGFGELVGGVLYTSRFVSRFIYKVWTFKMKLLGREVSKE